MVARMLARARKVVLLMERKGQGALGQGAEFILHAIHEVPNSQRRKCMREGEIDPPRAEIIIPCTLYFHKCR
jgi:hypothetical protein